MYGWVQAARKMAPAAGSAVRRLKAELRPVTEERDVLIKAAADVGKG
jgi:hypothetical protein